MIEEIVRDGAAIGITSQRGVSPFLVGWAKATEEGLLWLRRWPNDQSDLHLTRGRVVEKPPHYVEVYDGEELEAVLARHKEWDGYLDPAEADLDATRWFDFIAQPHVAKQLEEFLEDAR
jgi:hypothetical protein